jgi:4-cresol dehydrogenase (hydroxylating) flavoprotein subunit
MIDQARQTATLGTLTQALGKETVDTSPQTLARYAAPGMVPAGVVLPADEAQLDGLQRRLRT